MAASRLSSLPNFSTSVRLWMYPPQSSTAKWEPAAVALDFGGDIGDPTTLSAVFTTKWDIYKAEEDENNPLQLKSLVKVMRRGVCIWRGYVLRRQLLEEDGGEYTVRIECIDALGLLNDVVASWTASTLTQYLFTISSPALEIAATTLYRLDDIGEAEYVYAGYYGGAADPASSSPWLPNANVNSVAIRQAMTIGPNNPADGGSIKGPATSETGASAMLPAGIIRITTAGNTEWIQYDGYIERTDGFYYFNNIKRGVCGTSAAAHSSGDTAYQCVHKRIHPSIPKEITGTRTFATDETIADRYYEIGTEDGFVYFTANPANVASDKDNPTDTYTSFKYALGVFDETNTAAYPTGRLTMTDFLEGILDAAIAVGGPALGAGGRDVSISPELVLTRVQMRDCESVLDAIQRILIEIGLNKGNTVDAIQPFDKPSTGKICVHSISQKNAPTAADRTFYHAKSIARELNLEDIYSGILIKYRTHGRRNLATAARTWHSEITGGAGHIDSIGSNNAAPTSLLWLPYKEDGTDQGWAPHGNAVTTTGNNSLTSRLYDGNPNTGWGLSFTANPGTAADVLYLHFADTPALTAIDYVQITYDISKSSNATNPAAIRVYGLTNFVPGTTSAKPTFDAPFNIAATLRQKYKAGDTTSFTAETITAEGIGMEMEALQIVYDGLPLDAVGGNRVVRIRDIAVYGPQDKTELIQLTDDGTTATLDSHYIYAPDTYGKIVDANFGTPRVKVIDIGEASRNAAMSLGRLALMQALALVETKEYEITTEFEAVPEFGETVEMPDRSAAGVYWRGVCIGKQYSCAGGAETLTLRLINFDNALFGG